MKAAIIVNMAVSHCRALQLSKMHDQKLLILRRRSLLGGGGNIVAGHCTHIGSQYVDHGIMLSRCPAMFLHASPEIRDALMLQ
jgi:hypothetical protein